MAIFSARLIRRRLFATIKAHLVMILEAYIGSPFCSQMVEESFEKNKIFTISIRASVTVVEPRATHPFRGRSARPSNNYTHPNGDTENFVFPEWFFNHLATNRRANIPL